MEKIKEGESQKREDACARVGKSQFAVFFAMICGSGGPKSRLAKAVGAEPPGQMRDEKVYAVVARSTLQVKSVKNPRSQTTFGSCDVEKVNAVVARSTFPSQKC